MKKTANFNDESSGDEKSESEESSGEREEESESFILERSPDEVLSNRKYQLIRKPFFIRPLGFKWTEQVQESNDEESDEIEVVIRVGEVEKGAQADELDVCVGWYVVGVNGITEREQIVNLLKDDASDETLMITFKCSLLSE